MDSIFALFHWCMLLLIVRGVFSYPVRRILGDVSGGFVLPFAWMTIGYTHWILSHVAMPDLARLPLALGIAAGAVFFSSRQLSKAGVEESKSARIGEEVVFWVLLLAACLLRARIPAWTGSEKFPDLMYLQSTLLDARYPPLDRWLFPLRVNYYYMSYAMFASFIKLTSIPIEIVVNLLCATVVAMLGSASYAFVRNWTGSIFGGVVSALSAAVLGNAEWVLQLFQGRFFAGFSWWNSSRTIPFAITEFPYFSFLLGDLHPHYNALPWFALGVWMVFRVRQKSLLPWVALAIGIQYPLNAWQFPVLVLMTLWVYRKEWLSLAALGGLSWFFFLPFWLSYQRPVSGIYGVEAAQRTQSTEILMHWAPFWILLLGAWFTNSSRKMPRPWACVALLVLALGACLDRAAPAVIGLFFALMWATPMENEERFLWIFCLAIMMFCEFFSLDPTYGYDYFRMNTVFKFYIVIWWVFSILTAIRLSKQGWRASTLPWVFFVWGVGLVYPVLGTQARIGPGKAKLTLDGSAYWEQAFPGEREALQWIRRNTAPTDAILEAVGTSYQEFGRYSVFSGRPNLLGWMTHEQVWRRNGYVIAKQRSSDLENLKRGPTSAAIGAFLKRYRIRWIVLGRLEQQTFGPDLMQHLSIFPVVFRGSGVSVHAVP